LAGVSVAEVTAEPWLLVPVAWAASADPADQEDFEVGTKVSTVALEDVEASAVDVEVASEVAAIWDHEVTATASVRLADRRRAQASTGEMETEASRVAMIREEVDLMTTAEMTAETIVVTVAVTLAVTLAAAVADTAIVIAMTVRLAATWNPSAAGKVGTAIATGTSTDLATTTTGNEDSKAATKIRENSDDTDEAACISSAYSISLYSIPFFFSYINKSNTSVRSGAHGTSPSHRQGCKSAMSYDLA
jgi:hypothetical protein